MIPDGDHFSNKPLVALSDLPTSWSHSVRLVDGAQNFVRKRFVILTTMFLNASSTLF
jgi:hypothetical protein